MLSSTLNRVSTPYFLSVNFVTVLGLGLILGMSALVLSPLWVLIGLLTVGIAVAILKRPEIGLLGIVILSSTIIPEERLPRISIGVGTLYIPDFLLFGLLGSIIIRALAERDFKVTHTSLDLPLLAFYGVALLSTIVAICYSSLTFLETPGRIRTVSNYLTFFIVTNLVRRECQLRLLIRGLFLLATITALAMIVQYIVGPSTPILVGRVETLGTEGETLAGTARVIPPGYSLVFLAFTSLSVALALDKFRTTTVSDFVQWLCLGVGVVLTFKRHLWGGLLIAIVLLPIYLRKKQDLQKLIRQGAGVVISSILVLGLFVAVPDSKVTKLGNAVLERLGSLTHDSTYIDPNSSLRWRDFEYRYALPQIASHFLLGMGLGAKYRPFVPGRDHLGFDGRSFIHNGHIAILLQTGLLGYLSWVVLALLYLFRGFKYFKYISDRQWRAWILGFIVTWLVAFFGAIVEPMVITGYWTSLIGIMFGVTETILSRYSSKPSNG